MNQHLTGALRNTFEELAETAPPPAGLARTALDRARRQRIAGRTALGGSAAALCAALVALVAGISPVGGTGDQGGERVKGVRPSVITAYSGVRDVKVEDPSPAFEYSLLINPKTGRYDRLPYNFAMPSPDGSRVLVGTGDNSAAHPTRAGILDRASGTVNWIPAPATGTAFPFFGYTDQGRWSPDGQRILFTYRPRVGQAGFLLVDPGTLASTLVALPAVSTENAQGLGLAWSPDSNGVALTLSRNDGNTGRLVTGIRFYDLTGKSVRTVPAAKPLLDAAGFSPDGSRMALSDPSVPGPATIAIADVDTGAVGSVVTLPRPALLRGWADDGHLLVQVFGDSAPGDATPRDADKHDQLLVIDMAGKTIRTIRPAEASPNQLFIGPSTALPASAAEITF